MISILNINTAARRLLESPESCTIYPKKGKGRKCKIEKMESRDGSFFSFSSALSPAETLVLDLAISLEYSGRAEFNAFDIISLSRGKSYTKKSSYRVATVEEIENIILRLRNISLLITKGGKPAETVQGSILPVSRDSERVVRLRDGNAQLTTWKFVNSPSILLSEAERLRGLIKYPAENMAICNVHGLKNSGLKKYLLDRIYFGAAQGSKYRGKSRTTKITRYFVRGLTQSRGREEKRDWELVRRLTQEIAESSLSPLSGYHLTYKGTRRETINLEFCKNKSGGSYHGKNRD